MIRRAITGGGSGGWVGGRRSLTKVHPSSACTPITAPTPTARWVGDTPVPASAHDNAGCPAGPGATARVTPLSGCLP